MGDPALRLATTSHVHTWSVWLALFCSVGMLGLVGDASASLHDGSESSARVHTAVGGQRLGALCPGVEQVLNHTSSITITVLQVNASHPEIDGLPPHTAHQGVVFGSYPGSASFCKLHVQAPKGTFVRTVVRRLAYWCDSSGAWDMKAFIGIYFFQLKCDYHSVEELFLVSLFNTVVIEHSNSPRVRLLFETIPGPGFIVQHKTDHSGYVTIPLLFRREMTVFSEEWKAASRCVVVSFAQMPGLFSTRHCAMMDITSTALNASHEHVQRVCLHCPRKATIFCSPRLTFRLIYNTFCHSCLKMYISPLWVDSRHVQLASGRFNCSARFYSDFQRHVDCNHMVECENGEDETEHCPFSSPRCQGLVALPDKCVRLIMFQLKKIPMLSYLECWRLGGRQASLKTRAEQEALRRFFQNQNTFSVGLGLTAGWYSVPFLYSKFRKWADGTFIYNMNHFNLRAPFIPSKTTRNLIIDSMTVAETDYNSFGILMMLCEIDSRSFQETFRPHVQPFQSLLPGVIFTRTLQHLSLCPDKHTAHLFLTCDLTSHCSLQQSLCTRHNSSLPRQVSQRQERTAQQHGIFRCDDDVTTVHPTLVCDFRRDCPDGGDESFCQHPSCSGFLCASGQCVSPGQRCNQFSDCMDDSDETGCAKHAAPVVSYLTQQVEERRRYHVTLDGTGYFTQREMAAGETACPQSHFPCPGQWLYCLPVYTRCNGFADCVYGEDEEDCAGVTCPGFYRCRSSPVCVHADHLCDGWGQCPQRDDEWLCDVACPQGCLCQGHVFACPKPFPVEQFPQLRRVDATGSLMLPQHFSRNVYLVHLTLAHCALANASVPNLANLIDFDLADNFLTKLNMSVFTQLPSLKVLRLQNNPISRMADRQLRCVHHALRNLDISKTRLNLLDSDVVLYLPNLHVLDMSLCAVDSVGLRGFKTMPRLASLSVQGNPISAFPADLFSRSHQLQHILSSNYKLCCAGLLPKHAAAIRCTAPSPLFPSCDRLVTSGLHQALLALLCAGALLGNLGCFLASAAARRIFLPGFLLFSRQLQVADVCTGLHVFLVLVADHALQGRYLGESAALWTSSGVCQLAGFLSAVGSGVPVLIVCFTTLYHLAVLSLPPPSHSPPPSLTSAAAAAVTAVVWGAGVWLAALPFLPGLSHWGPGSWSGVCHLALLDSGQACSGFRWFTVITAVNAPLWAMVAAAQAVIRRRMPRCRRTLTLRQRSACPSVRVMEQVGAGEAGCWMLFAAVSISCCHSPLFRTMHDVMAAFVLPLTAALNPALYLCTVKSQRHRQHREVRLLEVLKCRLANQAKPQS